MLAAQASLATYIQGVHSPRSSSKIHFQASTGASPMSREQLTLLAAQLQAYPYLASYRVLPPKISELLRLPTGRVPSTTPRTPSLFLFFIVLLLSDPTPPILPALPQTEKTQHRPQPGRPLNLSVLLADKEDRTRTRNQKRIKDLQGNQH